MKPCWRCGTCCREEVCGLGMAILGVKEHKPPCPFLRFHDDKHWCQLVEVGDTMSPEYSFVIRLKLGIGLGCDGSPESEVQ